MSTRSVIAVSAPDGTWSGRYCHSDGYPTHMGRVLFWLYNKTFNRSLAAMLKLLITDHPAGWSSLGEPAEMGGSTVYQKPAGFVSDRTTLYVKDKDGGPDWSKPLPHGPICYCHGDRHEEALTITNYDEPDDREWAYVISPQSYKMKVLRPDYTFEDKPTWKQVAVVDLNGPEPNWEFVECGDKLERCRHMAWRHFPELDGTIMEQLSTAEFLGTKTLMPDDAYAYEIGGLRYRKVGSGMRVTSLLNGKAMWAELLAPPAGTGPLTPVGSKAMQMSHGLYDDGRFYYPVYGWKKNSGFTTLPGVKPIYPPTLKQPLEVFAAIRAARPLEASAPESALEVFTARKFRDE